VTTFSKSSIPLMRADTQFAVVDATLKGYNKWISAHGKTPQQDVCFCVLLRSLSLTKKQEQKRSELETALEAWAMSLLQRNFEVCQVFSSRGEVHLYSLSTRTQF